MAISDTLKEALAREEATIAKLKAVETALAEEKASAEAARKATAEELSALKNALATAERANNRNTDR